MPSGATWRRRWPRPATPTHPPTIAFMGAAWWQLVALLALMGIVVAMVYGPTAATLVELFPTRIRYTSMSLPYHLGNGWFGGLMPSIAFAIVAQTAEIQIRKLRAIP
jgi:MFS family permease